MQKANNLKIAKEFKKKVTAKIKVDKFILFGSRATQKFRNDSDFDVMIISEDFQDIPWYRRAVDLYMIWDRDYPLELLCYTPQEIEGRLERVGIVAEAMKKGIGI